MLFTQAVLDGVVRGDIDLAFRRWKTARVRAGSRIRTAVGVVELTAVEAVDGVTDAEARRAGHDSADALLRASASREGGLYRISLRFAGPDPREALRNEVPGVEEITALRRRLDRRGPRAIRVLALIAANPGVRAADLAPQAGRELLAFKADVRGLKELGLTESLSTGYRLSPRGEAVLNAT